MAPAATARAVCAPPPRTPSGKWAGVPVTPTSQTGTPRPHGSQAESGFECGQPCSEPTPAAPSCAHPGSTEVGGGHEPHSTPRTASCWPHLGSQSLHLVSKKGLKMPKISGSIKQTMAVQPEPFRLSFQLKRRSSRSKRWGRVTASAGPPTPDPRVAAAAHSLPWSQSSRVAQRGTG